MSENKEESIQDKIKQWRVEYGDEAVDKALAITNIELNKVYEQLVINGTGSCIPTGILKELTKCSKT